MRKQKGFTLIELMVVIVIIGILSALAIPKMFGVSAKAKAAEAPSVIANWETLQSAYVQEAGDVGTFADIGFVEPTSMWISYAEAMVTLTAMTGADYAPSVTNPFGDCAVGQAWTTMYLIDMDAVMRTDPADAMCAAYTPNFQ